MRQFLLAICALNLAVPTAYASASLDDRKKAETLGFAIECGCLQRSPQSVISALDHLFPQVKLESHPSLAKCIDRGRSKAMKFDDRSLACLVVCRSINWKVIHKIIDATGNEATRRVKGLIASSYQINPLSIKACQRLSNCLSRTAREQAAWSSKIVNRRIRV